MVLPFFDWHMMFNDVFNRPSKEGFDIVIGNPPYIQLQNNGENWHKCIRTADSPHSFEQVIFIVFFTNVVGNYYTTMDICATSHPINGCEQDMVKR